MKFSFLIYSYFPYGGQQRDFLRIVKACTARGHEVDVYTLRWEGDVPDSIKLIRVPVEAATRVRLYQRFTTWVGDALAKTSPHPVIGFNKMPLLDLYFAADPCFVEKAEKQRGFYYRFTNRYRHFKNYEHAVFGPDSKTHSMLLSPQQRQAFAKYYPGCDIRLHDVPPGISRDRMVSQRDPEVRRQFREEFDFSPERLILLQVGSGFRVKGVDRALQAIASLPTAQRLKVHYVLVGQDKPARFEKLARKLGVAEQFTVFPGRDDIPRFFAGADLLLHPAYMESAGYVLLEATIAGLPVLTTATCGYAFHIEKAQSGEVCAEPFDQAELNGRLSQMLSNLDKASWSENGLAYGKRDELYALPEAAADIIEELFVPSNG